MTIGNYFKFILIASLVLGVAATANAQQKGGFLGRSLELTSEDLELQQKAARNALDNLADGVVERWQNEDSGHSGAIMPTDTYEQDGMRCRDFRAIIRAKRNRNLTLTACKQDDGTWKLYF